MTRWLPQRVRAWPRLIDAWLTPRLTAVSTSYVLWSVQLFVVLGMYVAQWEPPFDGLGSAIGRDFPTFWTAARAVLIDRAEILFDPPSFRAFQNELFGPTLVPQPAFLYPPHLLPLISGLGEFPYLTALAIWSIFGLALYVAALRVAGVRWPASLALAISPAAIVNLTWGQNGFYTAALLMLGLHLARTRPYLAGALLSLLTVKPQFLPVLLVVLIADRNWRTLLAGVACTAAMLLATTFLVGAGSTFGFFASALSSQSGKLAGDVYTMMPTLFMNARIWGLEPWSAALVQAPVCVLGLLLALRWRRSNDESWRYVTLAVGTFMFSPSFLTYDMTLLGAALVTLLDRFRRSYTNLVLLFLVWATPVIAVYAETLSRLFSGLPVALLGCWLLFSPRVKRGLDPAGSSASKSRSEAMNL